MRNVLMVWVCLTVMAGTAWSRQLNGETTSGGVTDIGQTPYYAQTPWASNHRDSRNSDYAPFSTSSDVQVKWEALDGAVVLLSPSIGPNGNLYVATGQGPGTSHLHAFAPDGTLLWESAPMTSEDDLDAWAVLSAPVIDKEGALYISDLNQFWAFKPNGRVKWVVDLTQYGVTQAGFITAIITNEGFVGGITTEGFVLFFNRGNGSLAVPEPVFQLPPGVPPPSTPAPAGLWADGLMDPSVLQLVSDAFFGQAVQVGNTPSVSPQTGRIFITAAGPLEGDEFSGRLYGLDIINGEIEIALAGSMGGGSGTSPAISPDGTQVYAADNKGRMSAFDTERGETIWLTEVGVGAFSPSVDAAGTVYTGTTGGDPAIFALNPEDGSVKWARSYNDLAEALLPELPPVPILFPTGLPVARLNSSVALSAERVWAVLLLGYEFCPACTDPVFAGNAVTKPDSYLLVALDPDDGSLLSFTPLRDSCEDTIVIADDGSIYPGHGSILSSIFFYGINHILETLGVPEEYLTTGPPSSGQSALEPIVFLDLVIGGINWVQNLNQSALDELNEGNTTAAFAATRRGRVQLVATRKSIRDAEERHEIARKIGAKVRVRVGVAGRLLTRARNLLDQERVGFTDRRIAAVLIKFASFFLDSALAELDAQ